MDTAWARPHEVHLFAQYEARSGQHMWGERQPTGTVLVVCNCGYSSGWVTRDQMPSLDQIKAEHPGTPDPVSLPPTPAMDDRVRMATADWLSANGIDPGDVPLHRPITILTATDGTRTIRHTVLLRRHGRVYVDHSGQAASEEREAPLLVDGWPAWVTS